MKQIGVVHCITSAATAVYAGEAKSYSNISGSWVRSRAEIGKDKIDIPWCWKSE